MGLFGGTKEKDELILVFDVGSSSVGGELFHLGSSKIPKIIFAIREVLPIEEKIDIDRLLFLVIQALEAVAKKIEDQHLGAPTKVFCVLSSPWHISQSRVISLKKNSPFIFTSKLADDLIKREIGLVEDEFLAKYTNSPNPVRAIEFKNIKIVLNGYDTVKPLNQKTEELEMTIFISVSPEQVLKSLEEVIRRHYSHKDIQFFSFIMAAFSTIRDMYKDKDDFLLMNIGGEVTDISMVKKNILRESVSFPLGRNFLTRGVSTAIKSTLDEAKSAISLYKDEHADMEMVKRLDPAMKDLKRQWLNKFQEALATLSNDISIPSTIYIVLNKDLADFFADTIKTEQFSQYTLTGSKFEVVFLSTELFHKLASFEENVIHEPDLIIDSIYINRFLN